MFVISSIAFHDEKAKKTNYLKLATHGLGGWTEGGKFWNEKNTLQTGKELKDGNGDAFLIVDVRDLMDGANPLYFYPTKVGVVRRAFEWAKFKNMKGVVICCSAGQSRSNAIAMAYLIDTGMPFEQALQLVEKNPICNIDPSLIDDIRAVFPHTYTGKKI